MSLFESVSSRFTTADLTYFLADIDQHLIRPSFRFSQVMLPGTCRGDLLCLFLLWIHIWFHWLFSWGRSWLLVHCQHKPEHICSITFRLIWLLVSSINTDLLWMGCTWCRAGDSPNWTWTLPLMILGHKYQFLRPWCYPHPIWFQVLLWSIWAPWTLLLGNYFVCHMPIFPVYLVLQLTMQFILIPLRL